MNIAVVGAGIFGSISAVKLSQYGHNVTLFDTMPDILQCASKINQYRLHSGYHYPRSIETVVQSFLGAKSFKSEYRSALLSSIYDHYYAIECDSLIDYPEYEDFMDQCGLQYENISTDPDKWKSWISGDHIRAIYKVKEDSIDIDELRRILKRQLGFAGVVLSLNNTVDINKLNDFEVIINATYANSNLFVPDDQRIDYQFEICEKPIVTLSPEYEHKSIVIIDGPFGCIDPYLPMQRHVMGHVEHAIHHRSIGHFPDIPPEYRSYLNSSVVYKRPLTNIDKFKESMARYFPSIEREFNHMGSMYTIRTVLPKREHDDARPSYITKHSDRLYSIFSGKIGTAVDIADELVNTLSGQ